MTSAFADLTNESETEYEVSHGNVIQGDTLSVLPELPENEFHAVVCDPPYNFDGGFMQQEWDDIGSAKEYQQWCQEWAEKALTTLKPGGHLIAFSGNRSHHRLMCGVEDAGYEIRDTITSHYGEGFPKGQQIDRWLDDEYVDQFGDWRGMLKPATEFAVLARSPLAGTSSTKNQMEYGTGNLNVEACRIDVEDSKCEGTTDKGRYPPNLVLDSVMASVIDLQSGELSSGDVTKYQEGTNGDVYGDKTDGMGVSPDDVYADSGGASRFFYCSKASKRERTHDGQVDNDHPTVKPIDLMQWLVKMVTAEGQKVLDPFAGSGTTMVAAENANRECVGIEMDEEYVELAEQRFSEVAE